MIRMNHSLSLSMPPLPVAKFNSTTAVSIRAPRTRESVAARADKR